MKQLKQVWSCGGGRQSCAIAVLIITGKLPKPDISVIADTGRERFTTFPYVQKYIIPALNYQNQNDPAPHHPKPNRLIRSGVLSADGVFLDRLS